MGKNLRSNGLISAITLLVLICGFSSGLYEDQVFKFDWSSSLVGKSEEGHFWENARGQSALVVRTKKNVLASLDADSGRIRWRHVFQEEDVLADLDLTPKSVRTASLEEQSDLLSLRSWNPMTGALLSEKFATLDEGQERSVFMAEEEVTVIGLDDKGGISAQIFGFKSGEESRSVKLATGAGEKLQCESTTNYLFCLAPNAQLAYYATLPLEKKSSLNAIPLSQMGLPKGMTVKSVDSVPGTADLASLTLVSVKDGSEEVFLLKMADGKMKGSQHLQSTLNKGSGSISRLTGCGNTEDVLLVEQACQGKSNCKGVSNLIQVTKLKGLSKNVHQMKFEGISGRVHDAWATCVEDEAGEAVFQVVVMTEDGALTSLTPSGNEMWSREEALSSIAKVELVPANVQSNGDAESASSIFEGGNDIVEGFLRRVRHHGAMIQSTFTHLLEMKNPKALLDLLIGSSDQIMDDFGIRKVIVAASRDGKLFGLDNKNGKILWSTSVPLQHDGQIHLLVQRMGTEADPQCSLVYTNKLTTKDEILTFNPQTGKGEEPRPLGKVAQVMLLHHPDENSVRPILFVFEDGKVALEPKEAAKHLVSVAPKTFVVTKDPKTQTIEGQRLVISADLKSLSLSPVWSMANPNAEVHSVTAKNTEETVHSQGRVMADRSVLFKYVNPNLALVLSEGTDAAGKSFINVYLMDLVTGRVIFSTHHKRVTGPYHVIHSENWAVYTYYNEKSRRAELTSLELFEGSTQSNGTVFSSLSTKVLSPLVERQSYILGPSHIAAMQDTITEKGITTKHILMATNNGAIYDVPRQLLDPRRPNVNTPPEMREPGIPPYIPELQLPQEFIINYNQTLSGIRGVVTAPTGLESTSVVFVFGLDLYCTRVAPSKGFDLLKDDFDYYVITSVLLALVAAAVGTRKLSQRKALKQAWR